MNDDYLEGPALSAWHNSTEQCTLCELKKKDD